MSTLRVCEECGQPVPEGEAGCPRCCFALALASSRPFQRQDFGSYELLEETGSGSMGVVYRARQVGLERLVAIKTIKAGLFATEQQVRRFRSEARAAARLDHPNVVRVIEVGEHEGRHFFSMDLVEGASLARLLRDGPLEPARAARYLRSIAEAMEYAHGKGVFHRDLKPSNVLLDAVDQPRVTDFGLARQVEVGSSETATGDVLGTPSFMPPEQALGQPSGRDEGSGARGDVYSMGATLYALLCGRPPFHGNTALETLRLVIDTEPAPPRSINPKVPRDLETICLKSLSKDPSLRYPSAQALADELSRFLAGEPILGQRLGGVRRVLRWVRRRPLAAGATATAAVFGGLLILGALSVRADQLEGNRYSAEHVAPSVLQRFQTWGTALVGAAGSEELLGPLRSRDPVSLARFASARRGAANTAFESVLVLDESGVVLARDPPMPAMIGRSFEARDYFRGAKRHQAQAGLDGVHVSRVFPGQFDNLIKFAVSIPVHDPTAAGAPLVGVLAVTIASDSTMGLPFLHEGQRAAAVVGRWDVEHLPGDHDPFAVEPAQVIVLHPAFKHGDPPLAADSAVLAQFSFDPATPELTEGRSAGDVESNYLDPMRHRGVAWAGPWLVGMAPVGNTEYVVLIQTRDWIGIALVGSLAVMLLAAALVLVRNRRGQARVA